MATDDGGSGAAGAVGTHVCVVQACARGFLRGMLQCIIHVFTRT